MRRPAPEWTQRYEALRAYATGEATLDFVPLGLTVLWHRGVAAWMVAECSTSDAGVATEPAGRERTVVTGHEHTAVRSDLVRLLAGTALLVVHGMAS